jgi:hypothetical protein
MKDLHEAPRVDAVLLRIYPDVTGLTNLGWSTIYNEITDLQG